MDMKNGVKETAIPAGYQRTEVGVIPEDWEVKEVKTFSKIKTGDKDTQDKIDDGIYAFYVRSQIVERINSYSFNGEAVLTSGDGVGVGKIFFYVNGKFDYHQRVYNIHDFHDDVDGKYFYYYFSIHFFDRVMSMTAKSSVDSVRREMISNMLIPLPPSLTEQRTIANALSNTDALIRQLEQLIAKKKAIKQGAMQELLSGRTRLPGFEQEAGYKETAVGRIPKDWEVKRLGGLCNYIVGGGTPSRNNSSYWKGSIPWMTVKDFNSFNSYSTQEHISVEGLNNSSARLIKKGTLITSTRMAIGKKVIYNIDVAINQDLKALIVKEGTFTNYLYYWFEYNEKNIASLGSGSTVMGLSKADLESFLIPLPPSLAEQRAIATILSDMDVSILQLEARRAKYVQIKQGMMQELLTGKTRLV